MTCVEVAVEEVERPARIDQRPRPGEYGVRLVGRAEHEVPPDQGTQAGIAMLEQRVVQEPDGMRRPSAAEHRGTLQRRTAPVANAAGRVHDRRLREREQPPDLECRRIRHVFATVGDDDAQLVAGVRKREPALWGP